MQPKPVILPNEVQFFIDLSIVYDSLRLHQLQKGTGDDDGDVVAEDDGGSDNCNDGKR